MAGPTPLVQLVSDQTARGGPYVLRVRLGPPPAHGRQRTSTDPRPAPRAPRGAGLVLLSGRFEHSLSPDRGNILVNKPQRRHVVSPVCAATVLSTSGLRPLTTGQVVRLWTFLSIDRRPSRSFSRSQSDPQSPLVAGTPGPGRPVPSVRQPFGMPDQRRFLHTARRMSSTKIRSVTDSWWRGRRPVCVLPAGYIAVRRPRGQGPRWAPYPSTMRIGR